MSTNIEIRCKDHPGFCAFGDLDLRWGSEKGLAFICENRRRFAAIDTLLEEFLHASAGPHGYSSFEVALGVGYWHDRDFDMGFVKHLDCTLQVVTEYGEVLSEHPPKP